MSNSSASRLLGWAQQLQALAQSGLHYNSAQADRQRYEPVTAQYERDRYEQVMAIAAEIAAEPAGMTVDEVKTEYRAESGHATPKVDVRAVVFRDERVLLAQELMDGGRWTLPGGWADIGSSPAENAAREAWEETGYHVRPVRLLACFDRQRHPHPPHLFHIYKLFFLCELESDQRDPDARNVETGEVGWFGENELPELSPGRVTADQIRRFFAHLRQPELPAEFD